MYNIKAAKEKITDNIEAVKEKITDNIEVAKEKITDNIEAAKKTVWKIFVLQMRNKIMTLTIK